ncbi:MAG: hypothetical protein ABSG50_13115 [Opitutaceae bacterium]
MAETPGSFWFVQRAGGNAPMKLENPFRTEFAVLPIPNPLQRQVLVKYHLLASLARPLAIAEHFLRHRIIRRGPGEPGRRHRLLKKGARIKSVKFFRPDLCFAPAMIKPV